MLKLISTALMGIVMLQMPALATPEDSSWYKPNGVETHDNHPKFFFLLGDWESSDPAVVFKESWNTTATGDLFCYRSDRQEFDLFAFTRTIGGAVVHMRRMGWQLCDLPEKLLEGKWSTPINHRGEIKFHAPGDDLSISNKYDSPNANTVNLEIQTTSKGVTTSKTLVLKRAAPTKIPDW